MTALRTFYKADSQKVEVRIVTGEPYPGRDSEGDSVYENTHLKTYAEAARRVRANVEGHVSMSARDVIEAERMLVKRREEAAEAVKLMAKLLELSEPTPGGDDHGKA